MDPVAGVALLWLLFAGTHVGLATRRVREALIARLGDRGFLGFYSAVAVTLSSALLAYYAAHRFEGPAALALGTEPLFRAAGMAVVFAGVVLMVAMDYPRSPTALFDQPIGEPRGLERITRHPFFAGTALMAGAHALLATRLVGTVFFTGLLALSVAGAWHQDRKLLSRRGAPYATYLARTSAVPFAAILAGRQRLGPVPALGLVVGVLAALALRQLHDGIFAHGGAWVIGTLVGGAAISTLRAWRRARRLAGATARR